MFSTTPVCSTECLLLCDTVKKKKKEGRVGGGTMGTIPLGFAKIFACFVFFLSCFFILRSCLFYFFAIVLLFKCSCITVIVSTGFASLYLFIWAVWEESIKPKNISL